jgi:hypothetical protein
LDTDASVLAVEKSGAVQSTEDSEMKEKVLEAVRALPEHERIVTTLFYINGYSQKEIGEFLEVPVTTVKKRLYNSRKKLKERMMNMVKNTLKANTLPADFAEQLLRFPFPRREPKVEVVDCPDENLEIYCADAQQFFVPLTEEGKSDWTFYDWPGGYLSGIYEYHVIAAAKWGEGTLLRVWVRFTDLSENGKQEWEEQHFLIENETYRRINLERDMPGKVRISKYTWKNGEVWEPIPMRLKVGVKWKPATEVIGVSKVVIAGHSWQCLKVATFDKSVYAEWYIAQTGRTVLFRRYNGPGWRLPENPSSFESLAGRPEIKYHGITFRHWSDSIPHTALEKATG